MSSLKALKQAKSKPDLALLLGIKPSSFTYLLYVKGIDSQYTQFEIPKKSGGVRVIDAPAISLKAIQSSLSNLLLDCSDEIKKEKFPVAGWSKLNEPSELAKILKIKIPSAQNKQDSLSHGFERNRSIITNAMMHLNRHHVLNIDLKDFFGSFNFGRVRGFFIKNKNFELDEDVATAIAKLACYNNRLPQGSPCSPVIANLITHSLDIKLSKLALNNSCTYTRYADDITFSTREKVLPSCIARLVDGQYVIGKKLRSEITRSGFVVNNNKTRNQIKDSRQDVTGLIVNSKPNTKKEYRHLVRAQCNSLFNKGEFYEVEGDKKISGSMNSLEGKLRFIDYIDYYNRVRQKPTLNPVYQLKRDVKDAGKHKRDLHSSREAMLSKFLFYKLFYASDKPTIVTEGKTDNIYLKSAMKSLMANYPRLAEKDSGNSGHKLKVGFVNYNEKTRFLLELHGGGDYLKKFVMDYKKHYDSFKAPRPKQPVIIFVDNDTGPNGPKGLIRYVENIKSKSVFPSVVLNVKCSSFIHISHNLYLVLTPLSTSAGDTDIEYFFSNKDRLRTYKNKCFNTVGNRNDKTDLSKDSFATHIVSMQREKIDFTNFKMLLDRIEMVIDHYCK